MTFILAMLLITQTQSAPFRPKSSLPVKIRVEQVNTGWAMLSADALGRIVAPGVIPKTGNAFGKLTAHELFGVRVWIDGVPAPILGMDAEAQVIHFVTPRLRARGVSRIASVVVEGNGLTGYGTASVGPAAPGIARQPKEIEIRLPAGFVVWPGSGFRWITDDPIPRTGARITLYGTGWRHAHDLQVRIGACALPAAAGTVAGMPGQDSATFDLPEWIAWTVIAGRVSVTVFADGRESNTVELILGE